MTIEQAIEAEAQAQAICMQTEDFKRAYEAFAAKQKPVFGGRLKRALRTTRTPGAALLRRGAPRAGASAWTPGRRSRASTSATTARACRDWVAALGAHGWLRYCVPAAHGGALERLDSRALVILRETLAFHSPLADFAFAMQGLGSGAITLAGTPAQQAALPARGGPRRQDRRVRAERARRRLRRRRDGDAAPQADGDGMAVPERQKTWISNGGIADFYCVFAKTDPAAGARGITAFIVDADTPGLDTPSTST